MIMREASIIDSEFISKSLNIDELFVRHLLLESRGIVFANRDANGFIITRKLGDINEVVLWKLTEEYLTLFRAVKRKVGELRAIEREGSDKAELLLKAGFKVIKKIKGLYPKTNGLLLKLS